MNSLQVKIQCPRCGLLVKTQVDSKKKLLIYQCPKCNNNIVCFDNKIKVISKKLFTELINKGILETCGNLKPLLPEKEEKDRHISKEDITNLKILLETETDFNKLLENL